jgi:adenosylhomocysteine nucleosidase
VVSGEPILLIVAADRREFAALVERDAGFEPGPFGLRWSRYGQLNGRPALLAANGAGRENAASAGRLASEIHSISAVVSTGFAGALDPELKVGDAFLSSHVIQHGGGLKYPVELPVNAVETRAKTGVLLTIDTVAQDSITKARLRESGASAVDMEASAVAEQASRRGVPFYCVRAISDEAESNFGIDFNAARRADGTFSGWQIVGQAGLSPERWRELLSLRRDAQEAAGTLARLLTQCRFTT